MSAICALYFDPKKRRVIGEVGHPPLESGWIHHGLLYYDYIGTLSSKIIRENVAYGRIPDYLAELNEKNVYKSLVDEIGVKKILDIVGPKIRSDYALNADDIKYQAFLMNLLSIDGNSTEIISERIKNHPVNFLINLIQEMHTDIIIPGTLNLATFLDSRNLFIQANENINPEELESNSTFDNIVNITYNDILPSPTPNISLEKIIKFKSKRKDELIRLRLALSGVRKIFSSCESREELKISLFEIDNEIKLSVSDLKKALGSDRISTISNTIKELVSIKPSLTTSLASLMAGGVLINSKASELSNVSLGTLLGGIGLSVSLLISNNVISYNKKKRKMINENPYAYLYLARKEKILTPFAIHNI
ncbi:MAG: DUF6236 family protein [Chitinophagales bacterium]|nr:DUF6236 family protein [Chitinophagales bacterium]